MARLSGGHEEIPRSIVNRIYGKNAQFAMMSIEQAAKNETYHPVELFNVLVGLFKMGDVEDEVKERASEAIIELLQGRLSQMRKIWIKQGLCGRAKSPLHVRTLLKLLEREREEDMRIVVLEGISGYNERDDPTTGLEVINTIEKALELHYRKAKGREKLKMEDLFGKRRVARPRLHLVEVRDDKRLPRHQRSTVPPMFARARERRR